ncbi:hypothetical protein LguiB_016707 [Lonicera macranthoides]
MKTPLRDYQFREIIMLALHERAPNKIVWHWSNNGSYLVKSGYSIAFLEIVNSYARTIEVDSLVEEAVHLLLDIPATISCDKLIPKESMIQIGQKEKEIKKMQNPPPTSGFVILSSKLARNSAYNDVNQT